MIRKGIKPRLRIGLDLPGGKPDYRQVLPFRRSWKVIVFVLILDFIFLVPAFAALDRAAVGWSSFDNLFDLVAALFVSAWLLGWSVAPVFFTLVLAALVFGREVIRLRPGIVEIFIGFPLLGLTACYDVMKMRNLHVEEPPEKSGNSWRGRHFVFDYGANTVRVGSAVDADAAVDLNDRIQMISGSQVRRGDASPEELLPQWEADSQAPRQAAVNIPTAKSAPLSWTSPSSLALIAANLVPVAGTVFLGWNLGDVMVLYWAESAVIGFFNLCKIAVIGRWAALLAGPFFLGHFGGFMAVHFLFIYFLFVEGMSQVSSSGGDLSAVGRVFIDLWPALLVLFLSHAYSFFTNFIGQGEFRTRTVKGQMSEPYSRIIFMHLVLIFGGGLALIIGQSAPIIVFVIGVKIYFDMKAHLKEHAAALL